MGVGSDFYMYDVVVKRSHSLFIFWWARVSSG